MAHIWRSLKSYIWIPSYSKGALPAGVLHVRHDSFICVIWLIHKCKMAHSHVWHEFCIRLTWHGTRTCLSNGSFICHFYVGHVSWTRVRITQFSFVSRPRVCRSSMNESCKTCTYYTIHETWLRVYILHMRHGILQMRYYKWDMEFMRHGSSMNESCKTNVYVLHSFHSSYMTHSYCFCTPWALRSDLETTHTPSPLPPNTHKRSALARTHAHKQLLVMHSFFFSHTRTLVMASRDS